LLIYISPTAKRVTKDEDFSILIQSCLAPKDTTFGLDRQHEARASFFLSCERIIEQQVVYTVNAEPSSDSGMGKKASYNESLMTPNLRSREGFLTRTWEINTGNHGLIFIKCLEIIVSKTLTIVGQHMSHDFSYY
jgi:hypothetical protein